MPTCALSNSIGITSLQKDRMPLLLKLFLLIIGIAYPFGESTLGILPLGTPHGRVGLQVAPGMIAFILRTSF